MSAVVSPGPPARRAASARRHASGECRSTLACPGAARARGPRPAGNGAAARSPAHVAAAIERQVMCVTCKIPLNVARVATGRPRARVHPGPDRRRQGRIADQALARRPVRAVGAGAAGDARLRPGRLPGADRRLRSGCSPARPAAAALAPPLRALQAEARGARADAQPGDTAASGGRPQPLRLRLPRRPARWSAASACYISCGALTPSRSRQRAIVRLLATHSAIRCDSSAAAPRRGRGSRGRTP